MLRQTTCRKERRRLQEEQSSFWLKICCCLLVTSGPMCKDIYVNRAERDKNMRRTKRQHRNNHAASPPQPQELKATQISPKPPFLNYFRLFRTAKFLRIINFTDNFISGCAVRVRTQLYSRPVHTTYSYRPADDFHP